MESNIVKARINKLKVLYDSSSETAKRKSDMPITITLNDITAAISNDHKSRYWMRRLNGVYKVLIKEKYRTR